MYGNLAVVEYENKRVLTSNQLAEAYETEPRRISENFIANKNRYLHGKHFYRLEGVAKRDFLNHTEITDSSKNAKVIYLWTQNGTLLHAKSLNTDKAWEVYQNLVEFYFNIKEEHIPKITNSDNNQFKEMFNSFQEQLSEHTRILESLQQEKIKDTQTICTLKNNLKIEKRQIHKNPNKEKRSRIYEELKSNLFYPEFNSPDTTEVYNKALNIVQSTYIKDIFKSIEFTNRKQFSSSYNSLEWAVYVLGVGYTILHSANDNIYYNIASKNILFSKNVDDAFCDEYLDLDSPAEKNSFLYKNIISEFPQMMKYNKKVLQLYYSRSLDLSEKRVYILLNPTHMKIDSSISLNEYLIMLDMSIRKITEVLYK